MFTLLINTNMEVRSIERELQTSKVVQAASVPSRYDVIAKNITTEDINVLARLVWLEARGEDDLGQRAVVEVVLNRVISDKFPNTIKEVVYAKNQFTPAKKIPATVATSKEYKNVYYVLHTNKRILDSNVVYFSMTARNSKVATQIGCHIFCKL